ncbi:UPF0696 protein C11orf68 homolog isoform X1 [Mercenaria mercenaria]|uniref:UPF0696 protein C11orf68 homolog isoform X1 n=1 Tax=Mercenaria mercenaria TaxID=6596 RepID=UPI00234F175F|nr:UPF0696 protein C11orf68 homolog isoform X1 [Mercenaria mercenaria]XP_045170824.2 UPF0696 protein C11orf68 homolog isoform X1 [Mercenaria mercenaria]XP_045170832.2 UPF0696 protein C11orf68 homolog isoform X1 [Mercenaria mercenaria]
MAAKLDSSDTSSDTDSESDTDSDDSSEVCNVVYTKGESKIPFKIWLALNRPSETRRDEGYRWVAVLRPEGQKTDDDETKDLHGLKESFRHHILNNKPVNYQIIKDLAIKYNVLGGKWLHFTSQGGKVDHLWSLIASSVIKDDIPCYAAKVSAHDDDDNSHVICIYNNDFTNNDEVLDAEKAIRNMGLKGRLMYKPDVYTYLGIYAKNKWKIKPFLMISQYSLNTGSSVIESFV